ncbi:hypothetical protein D3C85_1326270 [compost metagenome]
MNEQTFCFWLQGFVELSDTDTISEKQWLMIKDHLKLVFDKKTPDRTLDNKYVVPDRTAEDVLKEMFKKPSDSPYWQTGTIPVATC